MKWFVAFSLALVAAAAADVDLVGARDLQDKAALQSAIQELSSAAERKPNDAKSQYRLALAKSYLSEIAFETKDKALAESAAEEGIRAAERAVALHGEVAEYHRILGTLCGQVIPANVLTAFKYGTCARESIDKALALDPRSSDAHLSSGVGYYYLPAAFGGGVDPAIREFERAIELNPKSADAYTWLGIALRRAKRNTEARAAFKKSLEINPRRIWTKQQLEKTSAQQ